MAKTKEPVRLTPQELDSIRNEATRMSINGNVTVGKMLMRLTTEVAYLQKELGKNASAAKAAVAAKK